VQWVCCWVWEIWYEMLFWRAPPLKSSSRPLSESLTFRLLKQRCLILFQAVIGTCSKTCNPTLGMYQVVVYSKQVYICDYSFYKFFLLHELLPGCNLAHWTGGSEEKIRENTSPCSNETVSINLVFEFESNTEYHNILYDRTVGPITWSSSQRELTTRQPL